MSFRNKLRRCEHFFFTTFVRDRRIDIYVGKFRHHGGNEVQTHSAGILFVDTSTSQGDVISLITPHVPVRFPRAAFWDKVGVHMLPSGPVLHSVSLDLFIFHFRLGGASAAQGDFSKNMSRDSLESVGLMSDDKVQWLFVSSHKGCCPKSSERAQSAVELAKCHGGQRSQAARPQGCEGNCKTSECKHIWRWTVTYYSDSSYRKIIHDLAACTSMGKVCAGVSCYLRWKAFESGYDGRIQNRG